MLTGNDIEKARELARVILAEVLADDILKSVNNFGDLHDHVDANCLGGCCESGHWLHDEPNELEILNHAQNLVNDALNALNG